jgi:CelD/BcsL family acetyltransferase involved in cellulose biosynthesis
MSSAFETGTLELDPAMARLVAGRDEHMIFGHPVWLRAWLDEFGENFEPVFLECSNAETFAVAPLMRDDHRLTFIGDPSICDYMDLLVAPDREDAYDAVWQQLVADDWGELDLWGLQDASPTRAAVKRLAAASGYGVREEKEAVAPRLPLPESFEDYLGSLGKKDRHELRRKLRRFFDSGNEAESEVYSDQASVVAHMDAFLELHTQSRQDKTDFMTPAMELFFRRMASAMAAAGLVRLFMLYCNHKPVASVFCFDAGSQLYMYNSGYNPSYSNLSVGLVSKVMCLRWAIENGKQGLDFLRGNEPYKYDLGATDQDIYRLIVRR